MFVSVQVRHVYLRAEYKTLETHSGEVAHTNPEWVSCFYGPQSALNLQ